MMMILMLVFLIAMITVMPIMSRMTMRMTMMRRLQSKDSAALHSEWSQEAERPLGPPAIAIIVIIILRIHMM